MRWSSLVLIEANFKTGSLLGKKKPTFPDAPTGFPPSTTLRHDIKGTSPEIPDQTSALVLVENLLHPSLFRYLGLHQKQVERPPHIDVRYERAGPLQRSKELVGLGDDSIMCVSSLRSRRLEVFGWKKEQAHERETRAPRSFLRPLVPSACYAG